MRGLMGTERHVPPCCLLLKEELNILVTKLSLWEQESLYMLTCSVNILLVIPVLAGTSSRTGGTSCW